MFLSLPLYHMSIMSLTWVILLDVFSPPMYTLDIAEYEVIILFTFVEQTNMELLPRQRRIKRVYHAKKFVINTMLFTKRFTNGSIFQQIILVEHQQRNKKKSFMKFSRNSSRTSTFSTRGVSL